MTPFKHILVDIDVTAPAHPALERAVRLARQSGARLTIVDTLSVPEDSRRLLRVEVEEELVRLRREQLQAVASGISGVSADARLLAGRPATAIVREVLRSGHDLVVRSHARDLVARGPRPYGAIDMELLRQCPCPVMLVGPAAAAAHPLIVGAVHASTEDASEQALNAHIVELTLLIAELEQGSPMLLQAWTPFGERVIRAHVANEEFAAYVEETRKHAEADLAGLADTFGGRLSPRQVVSQRGEPEDVIAEFVVDRGVDLVVMGTVARTGIAGLLIGNTAERVIRKLPCSVLAVKPAGFVSPVRLDA